MNPKDVDAFGNAPYSPKFCAQRTTSSADAHEPCDTTTLPGDAVATASAGGVPWHLRNVPIEDNTSWTHHLKSPYVWNKFDYAIRSTFFALLPTAILVAARDTRPTFISTQIATMGALIGSAGNVGFSLWIVLQNIKAAFFWLPFCTAMIAGRLWEYDAAWTCVYTFGCLFICVFSNNFTKRLALISFNICMVAQYSPMGRELTFPSHLCKDFFIGFGFGIFSCLFPFPKRSGSVADMFLGNVCTSLSSSMATARFIFFAPSNMERSFILAKFNTNQKRIEDQCRWPPCRCCSWAPTTSSCSASRGCSTASTSTCSWQVSPSK